MKKLPIGIQSFEKICQNDFYYVDKTPFIKKLMDEGGGYYFLSRPRRFGKSLFLDTLRQAFLCKKELFQGLYLENNWRWDRKYPVIYISFGSGIHRSLDEFMETENVILQEYANEYDISLSYKNIKDRFFELIKKIHKKFDEKVVVLIDEYDKPILDNIHNREVAGSIRDELKNFYSVLKDADPYVRFVFITGVSKFSKVSIFSGLNNLDDISLSKEYATICGYTQTEFETVFEDRLNGLDLSSIKKWYNGYSWLGERVYNPFDILLYLSKLDFRPYWFETGTPTFLIKLLVEKKYLIPELEELEASEGIVSSFDMESIEPETLLFQTGYLTIKSLEHAGATRIYTLVPPNIEVKSSLSDFILDYLCNARGKKEKNLIKIYRLLSKNRLSDLKEVFSSFFASIPSDWYRKNELSGYEGYYASIFYCYFSALGLDIKVEDATNYGRLDMAVFFNDRAYIFEFKVVEMFSQGKAMEQLKSKRYYEKYLDKYREVFLIGVEFSKKERNITGFDIEKYKSC